MESGLAGRFYGYTKQLQKSLANFNFLFLSLSAMVLIALCLLFFIYKLEGSLKSKELEHAMRSDKIRAIAQHLRSQNS